MARAVSLANGKTETWVADRRDARLESPASRIIGLIFVQCHVSAGDVQIAPAKTAQFVATHPLARKHPEEQPTDQGDRAARKEGCVLVRIEMGE